MATKLTAISVDALAPASDKRIEVRDTETSLRVAVQPSGGKTYLVRYKFDGKSRKLTIGPTSAFKLAEAREAAREAMRLVRRGIDPARQKQSDKQARIAAVEAEKASVTNLFENAVDTFLKRHVTSLKSHKEVERILRADVLPAWRGRKIESITKRDVIGLLDSIVARKAPFMANRTLAHIRKFFNWAIARDYAGFTHSPCLGVEAPVPETKRDRVLTDNELRLILAGSEALVSPWREFLVTLAYTATRRDEVASAKLNEFSDLNGEDPTWIIPNERTKNGRAHILPLPANIAQMLNTMPRVGTEGLAFTVTGDTPLVAFSMMKRKLDAAIIEVAQKEALSAGLDPLEVKFAPWRLHDLRRTAATGMAGLGIPPHIVEAALNHVSGAKAGVAGVYNRHGYAKEKQAAVAAWAKHLDQLSTRTDGANVVQFPALA